MGARFFSSSFLGSHIPGLQIRWLLPLSLSLFLFSGRGLSRPSANTGNRILSDRNWYKLSCWSQIRFASSPRPLLNPQLICSHLLKGCVGYSGFSHTHQISLKIHHLWVCGRSKNTNISRSSYYKIFAQFDVSPYFKLPALFFAEKIIVIGCDHE